MQKTLWSSCQQAPFRMLNKKSVPKLLKYCPKFSNASLLLSRSLSNTKVSTPAQCSLKAQLRKSSDEVLPVAYGQPISSSHPHLLADGEILPGVGLPELKSRRWKLLESIQNHSFNFEKRTGNHTIIIPSATKRYMSDKIPYVFRQNSEFLYFAGCLEPDSVLVLQIDEDNKTKSVMFVRPKDKNAELWDGARTGVDKAPDFFGVDEAYPVDQLSKYLTSYSQKPKTTVWFDKKISPLPTVTETVQKIASQSQPPTIFMHKLRLIKSPAEIKLMQRTCDIASLAINQVMKESKPGVSEHHLFAMVDYHCRMQNADYLAYPPVVAGGNNATTIHYISNTQIVNSGDMVLMDAGCEYGGYSSDITRTWPVSGQFSDAQRVLYELLLQVQTELIATMGHEGGHTLDELFDTMCVRLGKYLQEVNLIPRHLTGVDVARAAFSFCPHHVSHYLGMDVHDTPLISRSIKLAPGMVCTVEPGIYIAANRQDVPPEFRGLGLRIEDDVLVMEDTGIHVLTNKCEKGVEELENLLN